MSKTRGSLLLFTLLAAVINCVSALDSRQNPSVKQNQTFGPCGSVEALAQKVEFCAKPMLDLIYGTVAKPARNENDIYDMCNQFQDGEKCIRDLARRCATGIQRITISTFANSVQRVRKRECVKQRIPELLRTGKCIEENQNVPISMVANATRRLDAVDTQIKEPEIRNHALCCMINDIHSETKRLLVPLCPNEYPTIEKLIRGVTEDVTQLLCQAPKCENIHSRYKLPPKASKVTRGGLVSSVLKIVFSLGA